MVAALNGKVAFVTGAGSGIGQACARALAAEGAAVAIADLRTDRLHALRDELEGDGTKVHVVMLDVTDEQADRAAIQSTVDLFGRLDVLVNSAAVMHRLGFEETTPQQYDAVLGLNLRSVFFCTQGAAPALRAAQGKVVNLADLAGLQPWPGFAAHSVSKAGVVMLTRVLARSLAPEVTVNAIAPGAVLVPEEYDAEERERLARAAPLGRLGSPGDVVAALLYLLESADFVTGEVLAVDGGRLLR